MSRLDREGKQFIISSGNGSKLVDVCISVTALIDLTCQKSGADAVTLCFPVSLSQKLGLLALVNEESRFPKGTDFTLLEKLHSRHSVRQSLLQISDTESTGLASKCPLLYIFPFSADKSILCQT